MRSEDRKQKLGELVSAWIVGPEWVIAMVVREGNKEHLADILHGRGVKTVHRVSLLKDL